MTAPATLQPWLRIWRDAGLNALSGYQTAWRWQEMLQSSGEIIGLRLGRMDQRLKAGRQPDTAELTRMVTEKQLALLHSAAAFWSWQAALAAQYWLLPTRATGQTSLVALQRNLRLANDLARVSLKGMARTLQPYHTTTAANIRRLRGSSS